MMMLRGFVAAGAFLFWLLPAMAADQINFGDKILVAGGGINGGAATNSTLTIQSTSNGTPSGDSLTLEGNTITLRAFSGSPSIVNVGVANATGGSLVIAGGSSGALTVQPAATASGTVTLPAGTYTAAGLGLAQIFSANQTFSAALLNTGITTDATHTDATVCEDTTSHQFYSGSGTAGICLGTSSLRFKHDVHDLAVGLPQIMALRPIDYRYNRGYGGAGIKYGFAAEEVDKVMPLLVGKDKSGQPNAVDWAGIVPVLVKAIQQQQAEIADLKARLR